MNKLSRPTAFARAFAVGIIFLSHAATAQSSKVQPARAVAHAICTPSSDTATADFKVTEVDSVALAKLLPRSRQTTENARPLLINFWATWCEPCRVEFPDLVKIDGEFRPRGLEFFTVSLDDKAELATTVPAFLREMKATRIPAYLLDTPEPADAINAVDPTWSGALPATFLFDRQGKLVYKHTGRIVPAELRAAIRKVTGDR